MGVVVFCGWGGLCYPSRFPPEQEEVGTQSQGVSWVSSLRLELYLLQVQSCTFPSPPSAGDPAATLPRDLLRPPPAICGFHLHLRQVSLVLTHLVGSWGLLAWRTPGA